jgi:hypothetical protein
MRVFDGTPECAQGNTLRVNCHAAKATYSEHQARCEAEVGFLRNQGNEVLTTRLPELELSRKYHEFISDRSQSPPLTPRPETVARWSAEITGRSVAFHFRNLVRDGEKNTQTSNVLAAYDWAVQNGCDLVVVGQSDVSPGHLPGLNLFNKTNIDDLVAIFNLSWLVVGSSSGPMHLAAFTRTPHVVWGGGRPAIQKRYLENWNPFTVPVEFIGIDWEVSGESVSSAITRIATRLGRPYQK